MQNAKCRMQNAKCAKGAHASFHFTNVNNREKRTLNPYRDFTNRLRLSIGKHPDLITTTLSNIFTRRLIGNKTHGDLAEIAITEFINQFMYDFRSIHVGKDLYRAKNRKEDIKIINEITKAEFPVSLKAYGDGPLQFQRTRRIGCFPVLLWNLPISEIDNSFRLSSMIPHSQIT